MKAPYGDLFHQLPSLLRGAAAGGAELVILLVRLEDLCIVHPESRYAPVTKKRIGGKADGKTSSNSTILGGTPPPSAAPHAAVEFRIDDQGHAITARGNFGDVGVYDESGSTISKVAHLREEPRRGEGNAVGDSDAEVKRRTQELDREREERECVLSPSLLTRL